MLRILQNNKEENEVNLLKPCTQHFSLRKLVNLKHCQAKLQGLNIDPAGGTIGVNQTLWITIIYVAWVRYAYRNPTPVPGLLD